MSQIIKATQQAGLIIMVANDAAASTSGILICNGAAVSRTTYANLFSVTGTAYGGGDGSTTFNVPDLRGYFVRGLDTGSGRDENQGRGRGNVQADSTARPRIPFTAPVTSTSPAHVHQHNAANAGNHEHTIEGGNGSGNGGFIEIGGNGNERVQSTTAGNHNHTITTNAVAAHTHPVTFSGAADVETRPPNIAFSHWITV